MLPTSLAFPLARRRFVRSTLIAPLAIALTLITGCGSDASTPTGTPSQPGSETFASSLGVSIASFTKKSDDLYVKDLVVGTGSEAINGRRLQVHYTGWLPNGTQFETSVGRSPIAFTLGARDVIGGWDQGILGMRVGGKRRLVIGSNLAYGSTGSGAIGPNTTLIFDVELVSVQ
ncbi:MAG: FKBP-type peptidyl-prolyl cis-trans isomerase [Gemmatimonas sp.]